MSLFSYGGQILALAGSIYKCNQCPCIPFCPTNCCECCYEYTVSWPAATPVICVPLFGMWFEYTYSLSSGSAVVPYSSDCIWYKALGPSVSYTAVMWSGPGCGVGTNMGSFSGSATLNIGIVCVNATWYARVQVSQDILIQGSRGGTDCPGGGTYSNGMSVMGASGCGYACCPTECVRCPSQLTVTVTDPANPSCDGTYTLDISGCQWSDVNANYISCQGTTMHWIVNIAGACSVSYDVGLGNGGCPPTGTFTVGGATIVIS